jgi:hypothetical protein
MNATTAPHTAITDCMARIAFYAKQAGEAAARNQLETGLDIAKFVNVAAKIARELEGIHGILDRHQPTTPF